MRSALTRRFSHALVTVLSLAGLSACASLSGPVLDAAEDYHDTLAVNADRILIDNILRASYHASLSLSDLSTLTGAFSISGGISANVPFPHGSSNPISFTPSITAGSTPTFTIVPLNTNGFTTAMIQPIAPQELLQLWNAGTDQSGTGDDYHQFILRFFIKYMALEPDVNGSKVGRSCVNLPTDNTQQKCLHWFKELTPHSVTVIEPIGNAFTKSDISVIKDLVGIDQNAQYRIGNSGNGEFQLYQVYPGQVVLCTEDEKIARPKRIEEIYQTVRRQLSAKAAPGGAALLKLGPQISSLLAAGVAAKSKGKAAQPAPAAGPQSSTTSGKNGGGASGATTQTTVNTVLQQNRISSIFNDADQTCTQDEIVLPAATTEEAYANATANFAHVENRSTTEVFDYLGALIQYERNSMIAKPEILETAMRTFRLTDNPQEGGTFIRVSYRGRVYGVDNGDGMSMRALQILSQLVNEAKVSSDIQATPPALFLPIP